jgi:DNA-directed RNA polymerase subunit RPC12/RpoP
MTTELWTPEKERTSRASGLQIWLPKRARAQKVYGCVVCGAEFPSEQRSAWHRHVVKCAEVNSDVIDAVVAMKRDPRFGGSAFTDISDKEKYRWLRERLGQGRLNSVKKRLGFK